MYVTCQQMNKDEVSLIAENCTLGLHEFTGCSIYSQGNDVIPYSIEVQFRVVFEAFYDCFHADIYDSVHRSNWLKGETVKIVITLIEPVIFHFHRKPKRNLGFETKLPVST